jgi:hypothetical protein
MPNFSKNTNLSIGMAGLLALAAGADTLTGRVVGPNSTPLAGVRVTLPRINGALDTTGPDGRFELKVPNAAIAFRGGSLPHLTISGGPESEPKEARDLLGKYAAHATAHNRVVFGNPRAHSTGDARPGLDGNSPAMPAKLAAEGDTLVMSKTGWFMKKTAMPSPAGKDMGDVTMERDIVGVGSANDDKFDRQIVDAYINNGIDSSLAMVVKAMIPIESSFNAQAISMYDTQLPCGTHSYGLIQVTPGCERGYATLPAGTKVTATISGGLNGNPAVLAWNDPADKASGNTIVQEAGIIINLITNPSSPFWPTSAFNPAYAIDHGAKALKDVMAEMKRKFNSCTEANYVAMGLAGYNQGSSTVSGCTSYSANGTNYQNKVLEKYRTYCKAAGQTAKY